MGIDLYFVQLSYRPINLHKTLTAQNLPTHTISGSNQARPVSALPDHYGSCESVQAQIRMSLTVRQIYGQGSLLPDLKYAVWLSFSGCPSKARSWSWARQGKQWRCRA